MLREILKRTFRGRSQQVLLMAALTGVLVGAAVAAFAWTVESQLLERVLRASLPIRVVAPGLGLVVAVAALRTLGGNASAATSDEYIRNFHEEGRRLDLRPFWGRMVAGAATLGTGGALGFEGPSLYLGASIGSALQSRFSRLVSREEAKTLMVAGAAAGVAAIFKAPATGAIFALEVPFRDDTARRMLLPALLAAATGYLTFAALMGTEPLLAVAGAPAFDLKELGGAVLLGLSCGLGARGFAYGVRRIKDLSGRSQVLRSTAAAAILGSLVLISEEAFGAPLAIGPGYGVLDWIGDPAHSLPAVVGLLAMRLVASAATLAGGGVGGIFIPLVVTGALVGGAFSSLLDDPSTLFPLIGVAAFLGAGYRTPLAAVMFVAEATGSPGFVVPGLIASVAAQLVMGGASVSPFQVSGRVGHLERRFRLPIVSALSADVMTVPSDTTLAEFYEHHLLTNRQPEVAVVDGSEYKGMICLWHLRRHPPEDWPEHTVAEALDAGWPTAAPRDTLEKAVRAMEEADVDVLPVLDGETFIGIVTSEAILRLDEILDERRGPGSAG